MDYEFKSSKSFNGNTWALVLKDTQEPVAGETLYADFRGDLATVKSGTPPHKSSSQGKIYIDTGREVYPSVLGMEWIDLGDQS